MGHSQGSPEPPIEFLGEFLGRRVSERGRIFGRGQAPQIPLIPESPE